MTGTINRHNGKSRSLVIGACFLRDGLVSSRLDLFPIDLGRPRLQGLGQKLLLPAPGHRVGPLHESSRVGDEIEVALCFSYQRRHHTIIPDCKPKRKDVPGRKVRRSGLQADTALAVAWKSRTRLCQ